MPFLIYLFVFYITKDSIENFHKILHLFSILQIYKFTNYKIFLHIEFLKSLQL